MEKAPSVNLKVSSQEPGVSGPGAATAAVSSVASATVSGAASATVSGAASATVSGAASASTDRLGLEDIVHLANKVGLDYVSARKEAERLELLKNTIRSRITIRLDDGSHSEAKLRRLMETDPEYEDFLMKLVSARAEAEKLRVRYESYKNLFDAKRSLLSYQKAEMKLL